MPGAAPRTIDIGVYVDGEPERLNDTLRSLRAHRQRGEEVVVLLDDGIADVSCDARIVRVRGGAAAAMNALLRNSNAPVVGFLENGARVCRGSIARLVRALGGSVSIAGPSTNLAWNEQRLPDAPDPLAPGPVVDRYGAILSMRAGAATRSLAPLHSLGDFCYVARRDALLAVGGADEGYDPGPCWEMDLTIRAERAGHQAVWVVGAYVHRAPVSPRRSARELLLMDVAKRRYQDNFCGRRLLGTAEEYREHCRGDGCPNFAPRNLIAPATSEVVNHQPEISLWQQEPLVSCILPTRDRPRFFVEAVRNFLGQDYPNRELVVVDDGAISIAALCPDDSRIRYVRLDHPVPLGEKRNIACAESRGEVIAHTDDDDWYPPHRLREQVRALSATGADISGTSRLYFLDLRSNRSWEYSRTGLRWLAGSSLLYRRSYWEAHRFAPLAVGEDSQFLARAEAGIGFSDLNDPALCVGTIHGRNTSAKRAIIPHWKPLSAGVVQALMGDRLDRYRAALSFDMPLVSCVMPTFNRPAFVELAIQAFNTQSYPNKELVVVDDGNGSLGKELQGRAHLQYHHIAGRQSIGMKRNAGNSVARGEIVCLWDDDDWYAPDRVRYQVLPILYGEAQMTGLESGYVLDLPTAMAWAPSAALHRKMFEGDIAGGTLAYVRSIGESVRFPRTSLAEDAAFIRAAIARGFRFRKLANGGQFIYMRHRRNTWRFEAGKFLDPVAWQHTNLPAGFHPSLLSAYQQAGCSD